MIGDFDSISDAAQRALPPAALHRIAEQDSTDFDKCLRNIDAGELQACDRTFGPYLALPVGSLLQFAGGELQSAHLVDQAKLAEVFERGEHRTMGEVLASGEASRPLFVDAD